LQGQSPGDISREVIADWKTRFAETTKTPNARERAIEQIELYGELVEKRLARFSEWDLVFQYLSSKEIANVYKTVSNRMLQTL
jgi:hypothetical protein